MPEKIIQANQVGDLREAIFNEGIAFVSFIPTDPDEEVREKILAEGNAMVLARRRINPLVFEVGEITGASFETVVFYREEHQGLLDNALE